MVDFVSIPDIGRIFRATDINKIEAMGKIITYNDILFPSNVSEKLFLKEHKELIVQVLLYINNNEQVEEDEEEKEKERSNNLVYIKINEFSIDINDDSDYIELQDFPSIRQLSTKRQKIVLSNIEKIYRNLKKKDQLEKGKSITDNSISHEIIPSMPRFTDISKDKEEILTYGDEDKRRLNIYKSKLIKYLSNRKTDFIEFSNLLELVKNKISKNESNENQISIREEIIKKINIIFENIIFY